MYIAHSMAHLPLVPVVLAGGSGTRLWPLSRLDAPKQMLPLLGGKTMLRMTIERVAGISERRPPIVVCNAAHVDTVRSEMLGAGEPEGAVVVEPMGRNTAPAVAVAAALAAEHGDVALLVMPADHLITDVSGFCAAVDTGRAPATDGALVTFGIEPTYPATGFGYIHSQGSEVVRPVAAFVEKPDRTTAESFLQAGGYLWNSGMFLFRADRYLAELAEHAPDVADAASRAVTRARRDETGNLVLDADAFAASPSISIDYAVMERTTHAAVLPLDVGWSDIGSWDSLFDATAVDSDGNALIGDIVAHATSQSYIRTDGPLVAVSHLTDVIVVATPDAVLVADRRHSESVRELVGLIRAGHRREADTSATHRRPWGRITTLTVTADRVVDRLEIDPGASVVPLPGTWLVLAGTAEHDGDSLGPGSATTVEADHAGTEFKNVASDQLVLLAVTAGGAAT